MSFIDIRAALLDAQSKAAVLFAETEKRGLIQAGISEKELNDSIHKLAYELFGLRKYWHKRLVRAGVNALAPYEANPPNLIIGEDDLVFLDFGPVFEDYEADFGRTFQLGNDPEKRRMLDDLKIIFDKSKLFFQQNEDITSADLFNDVRDRTEARGWLCGSEHAGHLIGIFPHEKLLGDGHENYISASNPARMRDLDKHGNERHWILEVHLVEPHKRYAAFYEELLTL